MAGIEPRLRVVFAPDWRTGVPYQRLLAEALAGEGVEVEWLPHYRRLFPLGRQMASRPCDWLHLHWPEAYYPPKHDGWDWFRRARFPLDLRWALRDKALAVTAHNLLPHNRGSESFVAANARLCSQLARVVFAHSVAARQVLVEEHGIPAEKVTVVPHGDLSVAVGAPLPQAEARAALGWPGGKFALMFGTVEPYKGLEPIIDWWKAHRPACQLVIAGKPHQQAYGEELAARAAGAPGIHLRLGWMEDETVRQWLSAADCVIFNYRAIFTSGAASLARSYGVPLIVPQRLHTLDLLEPSPYVRRFHHMEEDFGDRLEEALQVPADFSTAAAWREYTAWARIARLTAEAYRRAGTKG